MNSTLRALGILPLCAVALLTSACGKKYARSYVQVGEAKAESGDYDGAQADYDHAIALDPECGDAYADRAFVKQQKYDLQGALTDLNRAAELIPNNALVFSYRGYTRLYCGSGDPDGAIADCTRAIDLDPKNANSFNWRAVAKQYKGDLAGAIADFGKALDIDPNDGLACDGMALALQEKGDPGGAMSHLDSAVEAGTDDPMNYNSRGSVNFIQGNWADAVADFRHSCELPAQGSDEVSQDYARLWLWMARARLGEVDAATKELSGSLSKRKQDAPNLWTSKVGDYFLGSITDTDLLTASSAACKMPDPDQRCEALFYIGMKKSISGDKAAAADCFRKCLATERRAATEYIAAQAGLKELGL